MWYAEAFNTKRILQFQNATTLIQFHPLQKHLHEGI